MSERPAGFAWGDYIDWLVAEHGTLTSVAERLSQESGFSDDILSIERALRRLRRRGTLPGGKWGERAVARFGLPAEVEARTRWIGSYHSRFIDLPVSVCEDLVRLWDRPPVSDRIEARSWLLLARANVALRRLDFDAAEIHLGHARTGITAASIDARIELHLVEAFVASRRAPHDVVAILAKIEPLLPWVADDAERACFHARWIDGRTYELQRGREGAPDPAAAERLYLEIPVSGIPPFALCRRANGLAYARWKQGDVASARSFAREACEHAGDSGHVRLRAMALAMLGRVTEGREGEAARARAEAISRRLEDELLLSRFTKKS